MSNDKTVETRKISAPLDDTTAAFLRCGEKVLISGVIYTGRDAAHKKMVEALARGEGLPFDIKGQVIYFVGPAPASPGKVIGSAGPTTSGRMDAYSPSLLAKRFKGDDRKRASFSRGHTGHQGKRCSLLWGDRRCRSTPGFLHQGS